VKLRDALGGRDRVSLEMHLEAEIKLNSEMHLEDVIAQVWKCTWRLRSEISEIHLEAVTERLWRCTSTPRSSNSAMHLEAQIKLHSVIHLEAVIQ
jgi:hypothetical protein